MAEQGGHRSQAPEPVPTPVPDQPPQKLSLKVPSPKQYTGHRDDLKPEVLIASTTQYDFTC